MLDRMDMVCLKAGLRLDRLDSFGEAWRVIRAGRGHLEAPVVSALQPLPGSVSMFPGRFMGHQKAGLCILAHHHPLVRTPRGGAVHRTRRHRQEDQPVLQPLLWSGEVRTQVLHPAFARCLGTRHQKQRGQEERNVPETAPTPHRQGAGPPEHTVPHRLGGGDALDLWGQVPPWVLGIEGDTLREDASGGNRIVQHRPCLDIAVLGCLPPPRPGLHPQCLLNVGRAQLKRAKRPAVVNGRTDKGVLRPLRDSRGKRPRHCNGPLLPCATLDFPWAAVRRGERQGGLRDQQPQLPGSRAQGVMGKSEASPIVKTKKSENEESLL